MRMKRPALYYYCVPVAIILCCTGGIVAARWNAHNDSTGSSNGPLVTNARLPAWLDEILSLPSNVPFPGTGWLERMDASPEPFPLADGSVASNVYAAVLSNDPTAHPCRNLNAYLNSVFLPTLVGNFVARQTNYNWEWTHYILCYLRNLIAGILVYYGVAGSFHFVLYTLLGRSSPDPAVIRHQIGVAQASLFVYVCLPVGDEFLLEKFSTTVYYTIEDIGGWGPHLFWFFVYMVVVEVGIYWMHRVLHTNKFLYKHVHLPHHAYNKRETLSPWASIAFHPLDGMLQACPYVVAVRFCPCHYFTHLCLLFFTAIWATYIHDAMEWNPADGFVMGSKYHTIHHTHYVYNYGQWFTVCDRFWGTYRSPDTVQNRRKQL